MLILVEDSSWRLRTLHYRTKSFVYVEISDKMSLIEKSLVDNSVAVYCDLACQPWALEINAVVDLKTRDHIGAFSSRSH